MSLVIEKGGQRRVRSLQHVHAHRARRRLHFVEHLLLGRRHRTFMAL